MSENEDNLPRVHAPSAPEHDVPTVARGGGAPIGDDAALQSEHIVPEGEVTVHHTDTARAVEQGFSPYGGLEPERPNRSTLDNSPTEGMSDNKY